MLLRQRTPTRYEITVTPVTPARRPAWSWALIALLLLAVAAILDQPDEGSAAPPRPEHTKGADVRLNGQE
ncbi:hypothetical protein IPZ68_06090 [Streptomyces arenae]|nr:hypothetical protein [Streptomyces arenae]